jgi:hypothetical protein
MELTSPFVPALSIADVSDRRSIADDPTSAIVPDHHMDATFYEDARSRIPRSGDHNVEAQLFRRRVSRHTRRGLVSSDLRVRHEVWIAFLADGIVDKERDVIAIGRLAGLLRFTVGGKGTAASNGRIGAPGRRPARVRYFFLVSAALSFFGFFVSFLRLLFPLAMVSSFSVRSCS